MSSHANDFVNWFSCTTPMCPHEQLVKITATNLASLVLVDLNPGGFVTEGHTKSERPQSPFYRVMPKVTVKPFLCTIRYFTNEMKSRNL